MPWYERPDLLVSGQAASCVVAFGGFYFAWKMFRKVLDSAR